MDQWHKAQPEKIKAKCGICGKKLIPRYTYLGEIYNWSHNFKNNDGLELPEMNYKKIDDKTSDYKL